MRSRLALYGQGQIFIPSLLIAIFVYFAIYTFQVISKHEFVLFSVFFVGIAKFEWAELFNAALMATLGVFAG